MEWENTSINIKNKDRQVCYNDELNLFKRKRTFCGIRCLNHWKCIGDHIDLTNKLTAIEIGSHEGQSAMYFLKNILINPESKLFCIDPWFKSSWSITDHSVLNYEDIFDLNKSNNDKNDQLIKYKGLNKDYYKTDEFKKLEIDIAYVDDIHTYESTKLNIDKLFPKLKIGGIIIFDDYDGKFCDPNDPNAGYHWTDPVKKAVDEFIYYNINDIEVIFNNYQIIIKKI